MLKEFKAFIARGNVLDLAVGVIVGGAFGKIVTSFVNDILMPPLGLILGKVDFTNLYLNLSTTHYDSLTEAKRAGAPTINYGMFINNVLDFLIVAFCIFLVIRPINKMRTVDPVAETKKCTFCLSDIPKLATRCPHCTSTGV